MNLSPESIPSWLVEWFPSLIFFLWSLTSIVSAAARIRRWYKYQREPWLLTDAMKQILMCISFGLATLIVSPHPLYDYKWLVPYSRWSWALGLIPKFIGSVLDWFGQVGIEHERSKASEQWQQQP